MPKLESQNVSYGFESVFSALLLTLILHALMRRQYYNYRGVTTGGVWGGVSPPQSFETVHSSGKN